jgi:uncharacterized repeat protein (TIGR03803 family)
MHHFEAGFRSLSIDGYSELSRDEEDYMNQKCLSRTTWGKHSVAAARMLTLVLTLALAGGLAAQAQSYTESVLYNFTGGADGWKPLGPTLDASGNLWGVTQYGGYQANSYCQSYGCGTVFKLDTTGQLTTVLSFNWYNGETPVSQLVTDAAGNIYGTASTGGTPRNHSLSTQHWAAGTLFKIARNGNVTWLHTFCGSGTGPCNDGMYPYAPPSFDNAGNMYGTTFGGPYEGGSAGQGTIYKFDANHNETILQSFGNWSGYGPTQTALLVDASGNLYGTAAMGDNYTCMPAPSSGCGVVFKLDPSGNYSVLHAFNGVPAQDGQYPTGPIVRDSTGNIYGSTVWGGGTGCSSSPQTTGCGVIYKVTPDGQESVLYRFTGGDDGAKPNGLIADHNGNLFGTTNSGAIGYGTVFELSSQGRFTVLYTFTGGNDGAYPGSTIAMDAAGNIYGTTQFGGVNDQGTIFKLTPTAH